MLKLFQLRIKENQYIYIWTIVDISNELVERTITLLPTGEIKEPTIDTLEFLEFIDTVLIQGGTIVVHVFENINYLITNE